ncbi:MAG: Sfum_1244 family protein [Candidatus Levyibacteriota bacterium]
MSATALAPAEFDRLVQAVQANCHVSDARHARSMTLCTYLMEMRELYRWERGIPLTAPLPRAEVGAWLAGREALWSSLESADYRPLPLAGSEIDPFDASAVNAALAPHALVYGAGVGRFGKPQFFLGTLTRHERRGDLSVLVSAREHARDLAPAPAASRAGTIYVRLESLQRVLWEKADAWSGRRAQGALAAALAAHGYADDPSAALQRMADAEAETLILHEQGEHEAGRRLGPRWESLLGRLGQRRPELFVRAVRDHLADCLVTLPALLARDDPASIHFWFANLDGMRRELYPRIVAAYAAWRDGDRGSALAAAVDAGTRHWADVCAAVLACAAPGAGAEATEAAIDGLAQSAETRL